MHTLLDFIKRYNYILLFIILEVVSIVLITRNTYYQNSKIVSWGNNIAGSWYSGVSSVSGYFGLKHENELLAKENAELRAHMAASYIDYTKSEFTIEDTVYQQRYNYQEAKVIKKSWSQQYNYIMINKGSKQGIKPDMAVISPQGIVGVVINTTQNFSTIMPILHPDSRNSVKIKRTGNNGSLIWDGKDYRYASVIDIPSTHKLYKNDTIVTSGLANDFPEGILVGYVSGLSTVKGSGFYDVKIRLATDFNRLDHVYVIDNRFKDEQDTLNQLIQQTENLE